MNAPATFTTTVSRIARTLGRHPQAVRRELAHITPDGEAVIRGNLTVLYRLESLPAAMQQELSALAQRRGLTSPRDLLDGGDFWQRKLESYPDAVREVLHAAALRSGFDSAAAFLTEKDAWQPAIPWNEVATEQQLEALKLERALLPAIARRNEPDLSAAALESFGLSEYRREFGHEIIVERWRYLFARTLKRDGGAEQFHRPELFLPGNLKGAVKVTTNAGEESDFAPLTDCIARFHDQLKPTITEIDALWIEAVELFHGKPTDRPKKLKRRLLDFLWRHASFLAASPNALRVNFDRKRKLVEQQAGETLALLDGRHLKRGESSAKPIPQQDVDKLAWHSAHNCGGDVIRIRPVCVTKINSDGTRVQGWARVCMGPFHEGTPPG